MKWRQRYHMLTQQELLVSELMGIMLSILNSKEDRPKKVRLSRLASSLSTNTTFTSTD